MSVIDAFLPDWIPNIHPMVIHFPIVILFLAVFIQFVAILNQKYALLHTLASIGIISGFIILIFTYLSGRQAADSVKVPTIAYSTLASHADVAFWTMVYFGILSVLYIIIRFLKFNENRIVAISLFLMGFFGMYLLYQTADLGGRLVYKYGVGVHSIIVNDTESENKSEIVTSNNFINNDGSWSITPCNDIQEILANKISWVDGSPEKVYIQSRILDNDEKVIEIDISNSPILIIAGNNESNVEINAEINLDQFRGQISLVHHVRDKDNYDYFSVTDNFFSLGRIKNNSNNIIAKKFADRDGWINISVVTSKRHFRGYLNEELLLHGHADAPPEGKNGVRINGYGVIYLKQLTVNSLGDENNH